MIVLEICDSIFGSVAVLIILKAFEIASVAPARLAFNVYPVPALLIDKSANVAIPPTAVFVSMPDKAPPPALAPMLKVMLSLLRILFAASLISTLGEGVIVAPAFVLVGCCTKTRVAAGPGITVIVPDEFLVKAPEVASIFAVPTLLPVKVALLLSAAAAKSPDTTAPVILVKAQLSAATFSMKRSLLSRVIEYTVIELPEDKSWAPTMVPEPFAAVSTLILAGAPVIVQFVLLPLSSEYRAVMVLAPSILLSLTSR